MAALSNTVYLCPCGVVESATPVIQTVCYAMTIIFWCVTHRLILPLNCEYVVMLLDRNWKYLRKMVLVRTLHLGAKSYCGSTNDKLQGVCTELTFYPCLAPCDRGSNLKSFVYVSPVSVLHI